MKIPSFSSLSLLKKTVVDYCSIKIISPIFLLVFSACAYNNIASPRVNRVLAGTFFPYHTALGAGRGIIFRIPIPNDMKEQCTLDSFYLNGASHPFAMSTVMDTMYLEANYFVAEPTPSFGETNVVKLDTAIQRRSQAILIEQNFYPSWITYFGKTGRKRIDIVNYKEIFASAKQ